MRTLLVSLALLVGGARVAAADGVFKCNNCNASGSAPVGGGLALIAGVAYAIGRRRHR